MTRNNSVVLVTGYGLNDRSSIPRKDKEFVSTPQCPVQSVLESFHTYNEAGAWSLSLTSI
jgi:hypothetical protein